MQALYLPAAEAFADDLSCAVFGLANVVRILCLQSCLLDVI